MMELLMFGPYFLLKRKPLAVTAETATGLYVTESLVFFMNKQLVKKQ